ncbi:MAG: radical SAM protein [Thermoplasmata archaeon]
MTDVALNRYYEILSGEAKAKYLHTKERRVDISLKASDDELWMAHDSALHRNVPTEVARRGPSLLDLKIELARRISDNCMLCERRCGARRREGKKGHCGVLEPRISSEFLHMGEEPDLVPSYTIFFSGCTFNCVFCQNWDISTRPDSGIEFGPKMLAKKIESKETGTGLGRGLFSRARNVNWVGGDPTSNLPFVLEVLGECNANLPQVWNSNMYLTEESMRLLDGVVDVYLTDFKYGNDECAKRLSNVPDYTRIIKRNHLLGRAHAEMIIRHLVLPSHIECCTRPVLSWIAENVKGVKVNVMAQYRPEHRAMDFPEIARSLRMSEYKTAMEIAESLGLDLCD